MTAQLGKSFHMSADVRGMLSRAMGDRQDRALFRRLAKGEGKTPAQFHEWLLQQLADGWEVLALGECEGFDRKTGCPGHTERAETQPELEV